MSYLTFATNQLPGSVRSFFARAQRSMTEGFASEATVQICAGEALWSLANLTLAAREPFAVRKAEIHPTLFPLITPQMSERDRTTISNELNQIPANEREDVIRYALRFMDSNTSVCEKAKILRAVDAVPPAERPDAVERTLLQERHNRNG
jgi:hypothetical protein